MIETGSTADGRYTRWADGTQICSASVTLTQVTPGRIEASWSFPMAFASGAGVSLIATLDAASFVGGVSSTGLDEALAPCVLDITASSATLRLYRIAGGTDFVSGDSATCQVTAMGRWF